MVKVNNVNKLALANDEKSLSRILEKVETNKVRDPYVLFKPNESKSKVTVGRAVIYPGCQTNGHTHDDVEEIYYFISGEGEMKVGKDVFNVKTGDTLIVPLYQYHSTKNTGNLPLEIFWVLTPVK